MQEFQVRLATKLYLMGENGITKQLIPCFLLFFLFPIK